MTRDDREAIKQPLQDTAGEVPGPCVCRIGSRRFSGALIRSSAASPGCVRGSQPRCHDAGHERGVPISTAGVGPSPAGLTLAFIKQTFVLARSSSEFFDPCFVRGLLVLQWLEMTHTRRGRPTPGRRRFVLTTPHVRCCTSGTLAARFADHGPAKPIVTNVERTYWTSHHAKKASNGAKPLSCKALT